MDGEEEEGRGRVICSVLTFYMEHFTFGFQHSGCCTFCCFSFAVFKKHTQTLHSPCTLFCALKLLTRNSDPNLL